MAIDTPMRLKTFDFNPTVFNPVEYKPQIADVSILERSLAQREARRNQAVQAKNAIDVALGDIESKLNPNEREWFNQYKNNINNQIQNEYDAGNFGSAFRTATSLAGNVAKDTALIGRKDANEKYNKYLEEVKALRNNNKIGTSTYRWSLANNNYDYKDIFDETTGQIIGGTQPDFVTPYDDFNFEANALTAFKMITPDKNTYGTGNKTENVDGTGSGSQSKNSYEKVSANDILANMEHILANTPDGLAQVEQAYNVAKWEFEQMEKEYKQMDDNDPKKAILEQQINQRKELLTDPVTKEFIDYRTYYARKVTDELHAKNLAYDWRVHDDFTSNDYNATNPLNRSLGVTGGLGLDANFYPSYGKGGNVIWGYNNGIFDTYYYQKSIGNFFSQSNYTSTTPQLNVSTTP